MFAMVALRGGLRCHMGECAIQGVFTGVTRSPPGGEGEGLRPSTHQWLAARGGSAVGIAPGRLAAAGGNRGVREGEASPHPSTA